MNKLTAGTIAFWSGSAVALIWSHLAESFLIKADETISILFTFHFTFFFIGLGCFIGRIIQWVRSR